MVKLGGLFQCRGGMRRWTDRRMSLRQRGAQRRNFFWCQRRFGVLIVIVVVRNLDRQIIVGNPFISKQERLLVRWMMQQAKLTSNNQSEYVLTFEQLFFHPSEFVVGCTIGKPVVDLFLELVRQFGKAFWCCLSVNDRWFLDEESRKQLLFLFPPRLGIQFAGHGGLTVLYATHSRSIL